MKRHLQYWGALYILALLFLGSFIGQFVYQVTLGGEDMNKFLAAVFENWQSEWLQLFMQALLIQALGHILYKADKADEEELERKLNEILAILSAKPQQQR